MQESTRQEVEQLIGLHFDNRELLDQVFVHSSYANEHHGVASNERLEFLGDAVIGLAVAEYYFKKLPGQEGDLTDHRMSNVNGRALAIAARKLKLNDFLLVGVGAEQQDINEGDKSMEDCFEALLGSIFLQFNYGIASEFVIKHLILA